MSTTVTQRLAGLLHVGRMPADVRVKLESEGRVLYLAEGVAETAVFRHFKAPGYYFRHRRIAFIGYFALTERRIVVSAKLYNFINLNVAFDEPQFEQLEFRVREKYLLVAFDPSIQAANMSGRIELRLHLPDLATAARILTEKGARVMAEGLTT